MENGNSNSEPTESGLERSEDVRTFASEKFNDVQDLLDHNKVLISEINHNHEERTPEALARNVLLIQELNKNVTRVVGIYKEISGEFENFVEEHQAVEAAAAQAQARAAEDSAAAAAEGVAQQPRQLLQPKLEQQQPDQAMWQGDEAQQQEVPAREEPEQGDTSGGDQ